MGCEEDHMSSITGIPARMIRAAADVTAPAIVTIIASITILMLAGAVLMPSAAQESAPLADPYGILKKNLDEMGGIEKILSISTRYYEADITFMGMQGRVKAWEERPMMKRREMSLGVLRMTSGDNGDISWIVDPNGKLQVVKDETALERREIEALLEAYEHANPESKYFTLAFEGMEMVGDTECYVVKILNSINDDVRLRYFDHDTFLQVKAVDPEESFEVHTLLSDYREVDGVHTLVYGSAEWGGVGALPKLKLPEGEENVVCTVHYYAPMLFTHQGAEWMNAEYGTLGVVWPGPPERELTPSQAASNVSWTAQWFRAYNEQPPERNPAGPRPIRPIRPLSTPPPPPCPGGWTR